MNYAVEYFHQRVLTEIEEWPVDILADYTHVVELLIEFGPELRMPHSRALGRGLFEIRARGKEGIGRAIYCYADKRRVMILHAFIKKTRETPEPDLKLARKRMKEAQNG
jgi:phage-related protein